MSAHSHRERGLIQDYLVFTCHHESQHAEFVEFAGVLSIYQHLLIDNAFASKSQYKLNKLQYQKCNKRMNKKNKQQQQQKHL